MGSALSTQRPRIDPSSWWWTLFRLAGELIQDEQDGGRHMLGWALFYICDHYARSTILLPRPSPEWAVLVRQAERRLLGIVPEGPPDDIAALFTDLSHLGLQHPLQDRRGGRRRRSLPKIIPWWRFYGE